MKFEEESVSRLKLEKLSPHSLRHLAASHQDKLGIPMNIIQENLRHSSIHTTKIYVHADDQLRHKEMNKMVLDIAEEDADSAVEELCLTIAISGNNVCTAYTLERFLNVVETKILDGYEWTRMNGKDLYSIIAEYEHAAKFGVVYEIKYMINTIFNTNTIDMLKTNIVREAEVRLLRVVI